MSTPIQRQYLELKKKVPEAILFFRLGDFYEMFFEDAKLASRLLGITLTARHKGTENEMPMCGVPYHSADKYLEKLIENGYKVAIAEQVPLADGKFSREISRVVTPGASVEKNLNPDENSYLVAIDFDSKKENYGLSVADLSTGDFRTASFGNLFDFLDEIWKLNPREILIPTEIFDNEKFCEKLPNVLKTPRKFPRKNSDKILKNHFGVSDLQVFGIEKLEILIRVSAEILNYLQETQRSKLPHFQKLVKYSTREIMPLDTQTMRHLEIFEPIFAGEKHSTLWSVFEKSRTAMGSRLLRSWLANPLLDRDKILSRLQAVEELVENTKFRGILDETLKKVCDLQRVIARLAINRGNARDLVFLRNTLEVFPALTEICQSANSAKFSEKAQIFPQFSDIFTKLTSALNDDPPLEITAGGIFRDGYSAKLDELRSLQKNAKNWLEDFLEKKKKESGIEKVRIKFSKTFGFCLEVSKTAAQKVPVTWQRRQTLVNAERFTTPELAEYETKVLSAESEAYDLEHKMFQDLRAEVMNFAGKLQVASEAIAEIDTILTLTKTALRWRWTKPEILKNSRDLQIKNGRHPVVEKISTERFIANDLYLSEKSREFFWLITGPNMSGKSTFLRQNALIILLAQMGSFVPAEKCEMGIVDRIFTRVGASDNLAAGKSTFFVEMAEMSHILNSATAKSFIILDEIGRGTSTFDGISLAWAITEFLHDKIGAKTIFATHYHELIDCVENLDFAGNYHVSVAQNEEEIIFLRRIKKGGISDSFGIEVAASVGFPKEVIAKSREILEKLETESLDKNIQPNLFSAPRIREKIVEMKLESEVEKLLAEINPDDLSPREALEKVYELKKKLKK